MAQRRSSATEERAGSFSQTTSRRSSTYSSAPLAATRNAGRVAGALRQTAADTAGRRSLAASPPCTKSCSPPLPGSRLRGGGALDRGTHAVQVDESLNDLAALAEDLDPDGQAVLALLAKPLAVQLFDGAVERPQLIAVAIRDAQGVINGLGPVFAQVDRVVPVLDQPEFDRVGDWSSSYGSFGAR